MPAARASSEHTRELRAKAGRLWRQRLTVKQIAQRLGRNPATIGDWLREDGVRVPGEAPRHEYVDE